MQSLILIRVPLPPPCPALPRRFEEVGSRRSPSSILRRSSPSTAPSANRCSSGHHSDAAFLCSLLFRRSPLSLSHLLWRSGKLKTMWSNTILRRVIGPGAAFFSHREYSSKIFISRLSYYTTDDELKTTFSKFGQIKEAKLVKDPRTDRPKGFGFIEYSSDAEAEKAIKSMDGRIYGGRLIFVEHAKS